MLITTCYISSRRQLDSRWKSHSERNRRRSSWSRKWEYSGGPGPPDDRCRSRGHFWRTAELGPVARHGLGPGRPESGPEPAISRLSCAPSWTQYASLSRTHSAICTFRLICTQFFFIQYKMDNKTIIWCYCRCVEEISRAVSHRSRV